MLVMTEANFRPSWPSYQSHNCIAFINRASSVHNSREKQYLATLGATYISHSSTRLVHNLMKSQL